MKKRVVFLFGIFLLIGCAVFWKKDYKKIDNEFSRCGLGSPVRFLILVDREMIEDPEYYFNFQDILKDVNEIFYDQSIAIQFDVKLSVMRGWQPTEEAPKIPLTLRGYLFKMPRFLRPYVKKEFFDNFDVVLFLTTTSKFDGGMSYPNFLVRGFWGISGLKRGQGIIIIGTSKYSPYLSTLLHEYGHLYWLWHSKDNSVMSERGLDSLDFNSYSKMIIEKVLKAQQEEKRKRCETAH